MSNLPWVGCLVFNWQQVPTAYHARQCRYPALSAKKTPHEKGKTRENRQKQALTWNRSEAWLDQRTLCLREMTGKWERAPRKSLHCCALNSGDGPGQEREPTQDHWKEARPGETEQAGTNMIDEMATGRTQVSVDTGASPFNSMTREVTAIRGARLQRNQPNILSRRVTFFLIAIFPTLS